MSDEKSTFFDGTLRTLPLPTRLVLSCFLISVGVGYFSALVQLHFNGGAKAGAALPGPSEAQEHYSGLPDKSQLERLITADETKDFNGSGQMREAFTAKSTRWAGTIAQRAKEKKLSLLEAEKQLRQEREVEINAVVDWLHAGASKDDYQQHLLPEELGKRTDDYPVGKLFKKTGDGKYVADIKRIIHVRCVRCHDGGSTPAGQVDLGEWDIVQEYVVPPPARAGGMSLPKLAQSTHVHLLGFSMLYGLTGLILSFTSYPLWFRAILGPWALLAQLIDISFWWLGRADPLFAQLIPVTGGLAALGLLFQIGFSLFDMYAKKGRLVLLALIIVASIGAFTLHHQVIGPHLEIEKIKAAHNQQMK